METYLDLILAVIPPDGTLGSEQRKAIEQYLRIAESEGLDRAELIAEAEEISGASLK